MNRELMLKELELRMLQTEQEEAEAKREGYTFLFFPQYWFAKELRSIRERLS